MRLFAWSLAIGGLVATFGSLLILWSLGDWVGTVLHKQPAVVVLSVAMPLMVLLVMLSQWVLGVRLTKVDGQLMFTDKRSPPDRNAPS
ncbi:MAG TPA: hypothetical protein VL049_20765 [Candidatus Dormibacteraeota bacterium]|nr:hypothetical protein [Candidatus Dormibacteraeota bacterium]